MIASAIKDIEWRYGIEWVSTRVAAQTLGISRTGVTKRIHNKTLPATMRNGMWWVTRQNLNKAEPAACCKESIPSPKQIEEGRIRIQRASKKCPYWLRRELSQDRKNSGYWKVKSA